MKTGKGILSRYALILEKLATASAGLTLTEIMQTTGLPQGTVHRLITALLEVSYIEPLKGRKVYILAPRLLRMLHLATPKEVIANLVEPELNRLVEALGETAFIAKMVGHEAISIAMVVPEIHGQSYVQPGRVMPVHASASGKAIFAHQDREFLDEVLSTTFMKFTEYTIVDANDIRADLELTARQGFAVCAEELDPGIYSYACPIHLKDVGVTYSVGLVGLTERLNRSPRKEIIANLTVAAKNISTLLSARQ